MHEDNNVQNEANIPFENVQNGANIPVGIGESGDDRIGYTVNIKYERTKFRSWNVSGNVNLFHGCGENS